MLAGVDEAAPDAVGDFLDAIDVDILDAESLLEGFDADVLLEGLGDPGVEEGDVSAAASLGEILMDSMLQDLAAVEESTPVEEQPTRRKSNRGGYRRGVAGGKRKLERESTHRNLHEVQCDSDPVLSRVTG